MPDNEQDITELLDAIVWGRRIIEIQDEEQEDVLFVLRPLSLEERNMGNFIYKQALRKLGEHGVPTREKLVEDAITHELWESSYEEDVKLLRAELVKVKERQEVEEETFKTRAERLSRTADFQEFQNVVPLKLKRLRAKRILIQDKIRYIDTARTTYIELPSAEHQAECERGNYLLHCATLSFPGMTQRWKSLEDLQTETNTILVAHLMRAYYNETIADESAIRAVARSGYWRCKWLGSKKNGGVKTLFGRDMYDITMDQFRLVYWSQIYDSAFESMDSPSDEVMDDDKLFDRWLTEQHQKRKQEQKKNAFNKKVSHLTKNEAQEVAINVQGEFCEECSCGIKEQAEARGTEKLGHAHDPSCSYGVYIYYNKDKKAEKVEEVQSANPERTRRVLANEQKRLAARGVEGVEEQKLRGDKTRQALGLSTTVHGAGEYGKGQRGRA